MSSRSHPILVPPEEYLALERQAEDRNEYVDGEIRAMTGGSPNHGRLVTNIGASLHAQLRKSRCEVFIVGMRVTVPRTQAYFYPDIAVACGGAEVEDEYDDTLLNPTLLVEVLSSSTEAYDRGRKWEHYRRLPSLQDYLLVSQLHPRIERYTRQSDVTWLFSEVEDLDAVVQLESIGCQLSMRDVYDRLF